MCKLFRIVIVLFGLMFLLGSVSFADIIHLKNGKKWEGEIIKETDKEVTIDLGKIKMKVKKADIEKIEKKEFTKPEKKEKEEKGEEAKEGKRSAGASSLEYQLATINAGGQVADNDTSIDMFRGLLDSLERKCKNSRQQIADMSVHGYQTLNKRGVEISLLEFMSAANKSIPQEYADKAGGANYAEITAALVVMLSKK